MADRTSIGWTDATWNPVVGCSIVSPGCTNCYAMRMAARLDRMGMAIYRGITKPSNAGAVWTGIVRPSSPQQIVSPLTWRRPRRIFVNSMSDLFHEDLSDDAIDTVFAVMALCPQHTFQVLTKRPARMLAYMTERWQPAPAHQLDLPGGEPIDVPSETTGETRRDQVRQACEPLLEQFNLADTTRDELWTARGNLKVMQWKWPLPNVWLGTSIEDKRRADERLPLLRQTPAARRFISVEPLLSDLGTLDLSGIHWVICGGESGPGARPMHPDWARSLRDQCAKAAVPFFFKQWGEHHPEDQPTNVPGEDWSKTANYPDGTIALRVGKHRAGNLLDGRQHLEFPA